MGESLRPFRTTLIAVALAAGGCPGDPSNVGGPDAVDGGVSLQEAMLASGELDASLMLWEAVLSPGGFALAAEGDWDTLSERVLIPNPCIEQRFSFGTEFDWRYRHVWTIDGCSTAGNGLSVESNEDGEVRWTAGPDHIEVAIEVPSSEQRYSDGETIRRNALALLQGGRAAGESALAVTATYAWRVDYEGTSLGKALWEGDMRMLGSQVGLYKLSGRWTWGRGGKLVEAKLRDVVLDFSRCPLLDPTTGEPVADQAPLMPESGRVSIAAPEGDFELAFGGCTATLLASSEPVRYFPADTPQGQLEYLMAFYGVVPGMWILQRSHLTSLNMALVTRQWCEVTGPCHRFTPSFNPVSLLLAGGHATAPTAADPTTAAAGVWYLANERLRLADPVGRELGFYAADLTDALTLVPIVGPGEVAPETVTWTAESILLRETTAGSLPRLLPPSLRSSAPWAGKPESALRTPAYEFARRVR